ncbi:hypothetical protein FB451DRAFT_364191 [Mycena latifolia]|nr:hypothetical protein FB451DRAFT_364191 [Mycena latifolia]
MRVYGARRILLLPSFLSPPSLVLRRLERRPKIPPIPRSLPCAYVAYMYSPAASAPAFCALIAHSTPCTLGLPPELSSPDLTTRTRKTHRSNLDCGSYVVKDKFGILGNSLRLESTLRHRELHIVRWENGHIVPAYASTWTKLLDEWNSTSFEAQIRFLVAFPQASPATEAVPIAQAAKIGSTETDRASRPEPFDNVTASKPRPPPVYEARVTANSSGESWLGTANLPASSLAPPLHERRLAHVRESTSNIPHP